MIVPPDEVIHIGIQARRSPFSELPPLNLAFVIDRSGSMASEDKLGWVKQAIDIFIRSVRDIDFVSLIVFDDTAQVLANFRKEYIDRVLFLTDGVGESTGILEMAEQFREMGISVSTIGVGEDFDLDLMVELAKRGGGSSRFISDREEMEETFGTWGYNNRVEGRTNRFHFIESRSA